MEAIEQTFNGSADFGKRVTCTVSRNGDLMHKVYLQVTVPELASGKSFAANLGQALIKYAEVEIGGQRIDKHYGDWMHIWNELSQEAGKKAGYGLMTGAALGAQSAETDLYIPLEFWFCRNPGLALPLIALQYHEVKINIEFRALSELTGATSKSLSAASLYVDYIYLDTDERRRFAQVSHEYLIEQVQFTGDESVSSISNKIKLNFNHPCKELVWVVQRDSSVTSMQRFDYTDKDNVNPVLIAKLQLNGHDRFSERMGRYFNLVQPYQHHTNVPKAGINVYSFGLKPEEHQPSGTCNMSRIDNATLQLTLTANSLKTDAGVADDAKVRVYATNYNVLRIMSGMGGLAYSN